MTSVRPRTFVPGPSAIAESGLVLRLRAVVLEGFFAVLTVVLLEAFTVGLALRLVEFNGPCRLES